MTGFGLVNRWYDLNDALLELQRKIDDACMEAFGSAQVAQLITLGDISHGVNNRVFHYTWKATSVQEDGTGLPTPNDMKQQIVREIGEFYYFCSDDYIVDCPTEVVFESLVEGNYIRGEFHLHVDDSQLQVVQALRTLESCMNMDFRNGGGRSYLNDELRESLKSLSTWIDRQVE